MSTSTLILYDTTDQWGWMGELYGIMAANLASRFGAWTALPIVSYTAGKMSQYSAVIYIGSTYGEQIPTAFFDDVLAYKTIPVIWAYDNIWQLTAYYSNFSSTYGWNWSGFDSSSVAQVNYKGQHLTRYAPNGAGIMNYSVVGSGVSVLANAIRSDGSTFPWALRSGNLTYVGENPLVYIAEGDRYLAFCDLLFDALAPATASRHRALIRLEDIDPTFDPIALQNVANYLYSQGVPFGFQIVPRYTDPTGYYNNGAPKTIRLKNVPAMVNAIKYMQSKGGVMMEHGYTHQYSNVKNPYTAVTGDDCEFFRLTMNADNTLNYLGPVAEDSTTWASNRISSAAAEFAAAGFPAPKIFTFPSYLGSATDIKVVGQNFSARAERSLYYVGLLSGSIDSTRYVGQYFPYVVRDVYNTKVLPDNLGGISPDYFFGFAPRLPAQILADAQRSLVVRDGFASFFYNPEDNISYLQTTIKGLKSLGYTFVSPSSL